MLLFVGFVWKRRSSDYIPPAALTVIFLLPMIYEEIRDAVARQFEYRANVPVGTGQPSRVLRFLESHAPGEEDMTMRSTIQEIASATPRLSADHWGTTTARDDGKQQTRVATDAGGQPTDDPES